ncbi:MAG: NCAIR mutase (PurE)-related protein [Planctomycetota bacterium]
MIDSMGTAELEGLLQAIRDGHLSIKDGVSRLASPAIRDLGHTVVDLDREARCGHPEVVYGEGKSPEPLVDIARAILEHHDRLLVTRLKPEGAEALTAAIPAAVWHRDARALTVGLEAQGDGEGMVLVVSAGTSDRAVAEEACITARMLGAHAEHICDVGVAGLHRLLAHVERLRSARVLVVVAGMEGALPSVVGGLVDRPIIAVPTSVGYGASLGGVAALLAMLNSCAAGISVVNIDNGFGAGYSAAKINQVPKTAETSASESRNEQNARGDATQAAPSFEQQ